MPKKIDKKKPTGKKKSQLAKKTPLKPNPKPKVIGAGRPTTYDPDFHPEWARKFALMGATGEEIAHHLEISPRTFEVWKVKHPEFMQSIKDGGAKADAQVSDKLHQRAMGYVKTVEQAFKVKKGKDLEVVEIVTLKQEEAPDTKAATLWLSNRQRNKWKDRQTQEHDVSDDLVARLQKGRDKHNAFMATLSVQIKSHNNEEE